MGIKYFYQWLKSTYPSSIDTKHLSSSRCDNLFIDLNGIVHETAQSVYEYGERAHVTRLVKLPAYKRPDQMVFNRALSSRINSLVRLVAPKSLVYISIDGAAPIAKQTEQRKRRAAASISQHFDSNNISAGTAFMRNVTSYLKSRYCSAAAMRDSKVKIIVSGDDCVGEGEHKLVNYISNLRNRDEEINCIVGVDADLILLSLLARDRMSSQIIIYRQLTREYVDINKLFVSMIDGVNVSEFILLTSTIGNDFIPPIEDFSGYGPWIDLLLESCRTYHLKCCADDKQQCRLVSSNVFSPIALKNILVNVSDRVPSECKLAYSNAYNLAFPKAFPNADTVGMVESYMYGLQWVLMYYMTTAAAAPSQSDNVYLQSWWTWHYKYDRGPSIQEIQSVDLKRIPPANLEPTLSEEDNLLEEQLKRIITHDDYRRYMTEVL